MPYGPDGQWRPSDRGALAKLICDIATGEQDELYAPPDDYYRDRSLLARRGGKARAEIADAGTSERDRVEGRQGQGQAG